MSNTVNREIDQLSIAERWRVLHLLTRMNPELVHQAIALVRSRPLRDARVLPVRPEGREGEQGAVLRMVR